MEISLHVTDARFPSVSNIPGSSSRGSRVVSSNQWGFNRSARERVLLPACIEVDILFAREMVGLSFLKRGRRVGRDAAMMPTLGSIMDQRAVFLEAGVSRMYKDALFRIIYMVAGKKSLDMNSRRVKVVIRTMRIIPALGGLD